MADPNLKGYRDEPENPNLWIYEDQLKERMKASASGDVDLREFSSPRHNQRATSSCVGNSVVKALEIKRIMKHGHEAHVDLSRLAVYYLARELMFPSETHLDEGTYISHAFDAVRRFGVPTEEQWAWDTSKVTTPPSFMAMRSAYLHKIESFYKIRSRGQDRIDEVVRCLQAGNPVVFGTYVNSTWYGVGEDHILKTVTQNDATGRHATVLVGFKDGKFIGENSWGTGWGDDGFYYMDPAAVADDGAKDFFVAQAGWEEYK